MSLETVSIQQARELPGLRLVVLRRLPSPWSQAAKGILRVKQLEATLVSPAPDDPPGALEDWTGQSSFPAAVYEGEPARTGWADILFLAERLAPAPSLIPADPVDRALFFGLSHEIAGEMGLGWCRRLLAMEVGLASDPPNPISKYLAAKYGYSKAAGAAALGRVIDVLTLLRDRLRRQRESGLRYLVGDGLSALDIYWATFCNLVSPLPPEQLAMPEAMRPTFTATEPEVLEIVADGLLEHRDFVYGEHLELPVQL